MIQVGCGGVVRKTFPIGMKYVVFHFKSQKCQGIVPQECQHMELMTGEELLHHLAHSKTRIPAIVLTGQNEPGTQERLQQAGAVKFLEKPVTPDQLLRAIELALSTRLLH